MIVSYTHLDVYKRQLLGELGFGWRSGLIFVEESATMRVIRGSVFGGEAVSYTHLDVYKRQGVGAAQFAQEI